MTEPTPPQMLLVFQVADVPYGIDIRRVLEIRSWETPRVIPNAPHGMSGVLALRGAIVPIWDMRPLLGHAPTVPDDKTVVVRIDTGEHGETTTSVGLLVDRVVDVRQLKQEHMRRAPNCSDDTHVTGFAEFGEELVILLQVEALVDPTVGIPSLAGV